MRRVLVVTLALVVMTSFLASLGTAEAARKTSCRLTPVPGGPVEANALFEAELLQLHLTASWMATAECTDTTLAIHGQVVQVSQESHLHRIGKTMVGGPTQMTIGTMTFNGRARGFFDIFTEISVDLTVKGTSQRGVQIAGSEQIVLNVPDVTVVPSFFDIFIE